MRRVFGLVCIAVVVFGVSMAAAETWKGSISDKMCGADHKGMDPVQCTVDCVKHGSPYVLAVSKDKVLDIENQKQPAIASQLAKFAGRNVTVTGTLSKDGKSVKIDSIK